MSLTSALATFFIIWWVSLFAVLPWGVKTQEESGEVEPGTIPSAPAMPQIGKKFLVTTFLAIAIFTLFYLNITRSWVTLDSIPFLPDFK